MQKPLWFEINKKEFEELTRNIYNNQDNNNFKTIINRRTYDLKNAKKFWTEVTSRKTTKCEVKKLYNELMQKDIDTLETEKSNRFECILEFNQLNQSGQGLKILTPNQMLSRLITNFFSSAKCRK